MGTDGAEVAPWGTSLAAVREEVVVLTVMVAIAFAEAVPSDW